MIKNHYNIYLILSISFLKFLILICIIVFPSNLSFSFNLSSIEAILNKKSLTDQDENECIEWFKRQESASNPELLRLFVERVNKSQYERVAKEVLKTNHWLSSPFVPIFFAILISRANFESDLSHQSMANTLLDHPQIIETYPELFQMIMKSGEASPFLRTKLGAIKFYDGRMG